MYSYTSFCTRKHQMIKNLNVKCDKGTAELKRENVLLVMKLLLNLLILTAHTLSLSRTFIHCVTHSHVRAQYSQSLCCCCC